MRATLASKKIQEWLAELSAWPWPQDGGSSGFEMPLSKRRKTLSDSRNSIASAELNPEPEYMGSLLAEDVEAYEIAIEEILEDMDDLHVEDIKSTVLNSHFSQVSRPSSATSLSSNSSTMPAALSNYTKMDDFTAVVTATVLQALPNLSKLMRLMDVWSIRLTVLRKVPPLLDLLDDVEIALRSGWQAMESPTKTPTKAEGDTISEDFIDRKTFEAMRDILQDKVTSLGRDLDYMLDTLEGRADTLPEHWLDRMEVLEKDYGEWVVNGEKVVREGEWNKLAKARKAAEARRRAEEAARVAAEEQRIEEERAMLEELARQEAEYNRQKEEERLRLEEAATAEEIRLRKEKEDALRLEEEKAAEDARLRAREASEREEEALRLREAEVAKAAELAREAEEARIEKEALRLEKLKAMEADEAAELIKQTTAGKPSASTATTQNEDEWIVVDAPQNPGRARDPETLEHAKISDGNTSTPQTSRNVSLLSSYALSEPSPELFEAQPAEYVRPTLSPIRAKYSASDLEPKTPSSPPETETELASDPVRAVEERSSPISAAQDSPSNDLEELGYSREDIQEPALARRTSVTHIKFPIKRIELPRRNSAASNVSSANARQRRHTASSPVVSSPLALHQTSDLYDESPSATKLSSFQNAYDYTPPGTPPSLAPKMDQHSAPLSPVSRSPFTDSSTLDAETSATDLSLDSSSNTPAPRPSSPRKYVKNSTDDQLQAQISNLLESIPAHIRLASEPPEDHIAPRPLPSEGLRVPKHRVSLGSPAVRSQSSLSMRSRAPTPSFTLAPAYGKGTSRPRPHSNNPEIKLYHLSRSGEAPIKLFVRLVGENGERVMVRVGGGWADLGEYLKEYASHHGRRSGSKDDKFEIQDMGSRNVSGTSVASSSSTIRSSGRASPAMRPSPVLDNDRPMSSLYVRKSRKSDADSTISPALSLNLRSPSMPIAFTSRTANQLNTPPTARTSSEVSLGLAGPKGKNVKMSEKDTEWVESIKEKVSLAAKDKEMKEMKQHKREERDVVRRDRGSFGTLDHVGGTKRLYKKT
jgi:hypothetical protein